MDYTIVLSALSLLLITGTGNILQPYKRYYKKRSTGPQNINFYTPLAIIKGFLVIFRWQNLKNVQIDPQRTDIWPKQLIGTLSVRE